MVSEDLKPYLRMVGSLPENDPAQPSVIWARGVDKAPIQLVADPSTVRRFEDGRLNAKIGEYCGILHGGVPGGTAGLMAASSLFKGLERPCIKIGRADEIYAYVVNPDCTYIYPRNAKMSGAGPSRQSKPLRSVFVAYVDLSPTEVPLGSGVKISGSGSILFWEWVLADAANPNLPADFENRYAQQIW
jgi:hypothetical protein